MLVSRVKFGPYEFKTPIICGAVRARDVPGMKRLMEKAFREGADLVELRIDSLREISGWKKLLNNGKPVILTNRPKREGGGFWGREEERVELLLEGVEYGAPCVDLEFSTPQKLRSVARAKAKRTGASLLLSYHDFSSTPDFTRLLKTAKEMEKSGCDLLKLVTFAREKTHAFRMLEFIARAQAELGPPLIAFAMGRAGIITRFIGPILGVPLVYAAVGAKTAPGQRGVKSTKAMLTEFMRAGVKG
jgi:3-dehydroquinate dehydratase type I